LFFLCCVLIGHLLDSVLVEHAPGLDLASAARDSSCRPLAAVIFARAGFSSVSCAQDFSSEWILVARSRLLFAGFQIPHSTRIWSAVTVGSDIFSSCRASAPISVFSYAISLAVAIGNLSCLL
jgi:hypothetical protein